MFRFDTGKHNCINSTELVKEGTRISVEILRMSWPVYFILFK